MCEAPACCPVSSCCWRINVAIRSVISAIWVNRSVRSVRNGINSLILVPIVPIVYVNEECSSGVPNGLVTLWIMATPGVWKTSRATLSRAIMSVELRIS
ncbi:Uncharacterised protein [Mycobacteroides abscessus subsp. massiliense]|nr:Uncharacterised protein [Mycobacteroides abscessus subsp. massiliense]